MYISAALSSYNAATLFNWTSPSIPILISDPNYDIDLESSSYFTVIPPIACIVASPVYGLCVEKYGRKYTLLSSGVLHLGAWILIAFARSVYVFYLSRILFGIADGAIFSVLPIYVGEVSTPKVRGTWGNAMTYFIYLGQFSINCVGFFFNLKTTAYLFSVTPIVFFFTFSLMPETPYYLAMKGKVDEAKESLKKLRRVEDVDEEFNRILKDLERQLSEKSTYRDLFTIKINRKAMALTTMVRGFQQVSGISAFSTYCQYIFRESGQDIDKGVSAMLFTGSLFLCNLLGSTFADKLGRKLSTCLSCIGCSLVLAMEAVYFYINEHTNLDLSAISWFPTLGMILFVVSFALGLGIIPMLLLSEMFSSSVRGKAASVMTILFMVYVIFFTKLFQLLVYNYGLYLPFTIFSLCTFVSTFLSYSLIPETKGKTLEEIQIMLKSNKL